MDVFIAGEGETTAGLILQPESKEKEKERETVAERRATDQERKS